ncbi:MAG: serine/threonine-protein kinase [Planctomycetota bacterium]
MSIVENETSQALAPLIERLASARQAKADQARSWASLGRNRPDKLGDFELRDPIGRGGMGVVFEAWQTTLERNVALKILPPGSFGHHRNQRRFQREARIVAGLHHTHIVPIYGVGHDAGYHYIVMRRLPGIGLDEYLDRNGPLSPRLAARVAAAAASALSHAHQHGVLHRDIKPSNLIVGDLQDEGPVQLWVTDFGVATHVEMEYTTKDSDAVGTLAYMAPEQIAGDADSRSDLYGLGLTLHEMLTGEPLRQRSDVADRMKFNQSANTKLTRHSGIPRNLLMILKHCLQDDPQRRYQEASQLSSDLKAFVEGRSISITPESATRQALRWGKRNPVAAGLAGIAAASLLLLAVTMTSAMWQYAALANREHDALIAARRNANLADETLHQVFEHLGITDESAAGESVMGRDRATVDLLEELLPYYIEVASRESNDPSRSGSLQEALTSVAKIQFELGRYGSVVASAGRILDRLPDAQDRSDEDWNRFASINRLAAIALKLEGQDDLAEARFLTTIEALSEPDALGWSEGPNAKLELARLHYRRVWKVLPGMGPNHFPPVEEMQRYGLGLENTAEPNEESDQPSHQEMTKDSLKKTIKITQDLLGDRDAGKDVKRSAARLLAASIREGSRALPDQPPRGRKPGRPPNGRPPDGRRPRGPRPPKMDIDESIDELRSLVAKFPDDLLIQYELATSLSDMNVFADDFESRDKAIEELSKRIVRLREALPKFEVLARQATDHRLFRSGLIHTQFKLGRSLQAMADLGVEDSDTLRGEALKLYRRAGGNQQYLIRTTSSPTPAMRVWLFLFRRHSEQLRDEVSPSQLTRVLPRGLMPAEVVGELRYASATLDR